jgi:hypothetical protein
MKLQRDAPPHGGIAVEFPTTSEIIHDLTYQAPYP